MKQQQQNRQIKKQNIFTKKRKHYIIESDSENDSGNDQDDDYNDDDNIVKSNYIKIKKKKVKAPKKKQGIIDYINEK